MQKELQTMKTLIRLLLKEQSDLGLHCLQLGCRLKTPKIIKAICVYLVIEG